MTSLNFPQYEFRTKTEGGRMLIFDCVRKKYISLTPEEWVRQHLINYLSTAKGYPLALLSVEKPVRYTRQTKRSDLLVSDCNGRQLMLAECKAPKVSITNKVFEQIAIYNLKIHAPFLLITNGIEHYCMSAATESAPTIFLKEIPDYDNLKNFWSEVEKKCQF